MNALRTSWYPALALSACLLGHSAFAQNQTAGQNSDPTPLAAPVPAKAQPAENAVQTPAPLSQSQRLSQLLGSEIVLSTNVAAGEVADVIIGPAGTVDYLIGNDNGRLYTIPYEATVIDAATGVIQLPLTVSEYRGTLFFTNKKWPAFDDPDYRSEVARIFGLSPAERGTATVTAPGSTRQRPRRASGNVGVTVVPEPRTADTDPLPGGTGIGVRGRGSATATGSAAIGGAGAAGAPAGATTGANKPVPIPKPTNNP